MAKEIDYNRITRQNVLDAVSKIDTERISLIPSTKFDVIINGKSYPPKEIMRFANLEANDTDEWPFGGGEPTNKFLNALGFETVQSKGLKESNQDKIPLTGRVWKLGVIWGAGQPNFYDMINDHSIVIGVNDNLQIGDLVIITEGHDVFAIVKVIEGAVPITSLPDLIPEFSQHNIDINKSVKVASGEWYELEEDDYFQYSLQQGICQVRDNYTKNAALNIWRDRFITYWIFQGNPKEYDFQKAIQEKVLDSWTVTSYKDKIKKDDKVILWLTGKKSGCYALARVTSPPNDEVHTLDDHMWSTSPKMSLKAGIEIIEDLSENPILLENIKENAELKKLNVGNRGTNFSATKKQYKALIKLINKPQQKMEAKIDLFLNTILYGPPGTGKTYKLNEYRDKHFVDEGIPKSSEEQLKEKIASFPLWMIIAAVLGTSKEPLTVNEIVENPLIKAKSNPGIVTKQRTMVWNSLLYYSDDQSTKSEYKNGRSFQLFAKVEQSKWKISDDQVSDLGDNIGHDLLELAANPALATVAGEAIRTRYNFITFHQKYSYEDFIEGIKPLIKQDEFSEESTHLQFEMKKGIFYNSCLEALNLVGYRTFEECFADDERVRYAKFQSAKEDPSKQFALFIDEINRANISAVFGELITLLEDDKRIGGDNEMWLELPYSNEKFSVPSNLFVIGTMNTADRSIAMLDIALRRRFEFVGLYPEYQDEHWWSTFLQNLNEAIYTVKKNPDFFIGHAFFINKQETEKIRILNSKIIPLLYEYCQNNTETVKKIITQAGIQIKATGIRENYQIIAE